MILLGSLYYSKPLIKRFWIKINLYLRNMIALITGSSKGIGLAIAKVFIKEGIEVILTGRNREELLALQLELKSFNSQLRIWVHASDLSQRAGIDSLIQFIKKEKISLDILVNNAGTFLQGTIKTEPDHQMELLMNTNFYSVYHLTRGLLHHFIQKQSGAIFNMCSIAGLQAYPGGSSYCISKFALSGFSKCLREELKNDGVKVCTIYPGATWSDSWAGAELPEDRLMQGDDIAQAILAVLKMSPSAVVEEIILRPQLGDL